MKWLRTSNTQRISTILAALAITTLLAGAAQAQIVFNEVRYKDSGGSFVNQVVELKNVGGSPVNIGGWIFCHQFIYNSTMPANFTIPAGGYALVHFNQSGSNSSTEVFFPGDQLAAVTDLALYATASFSSPSAMRAFIQFGGHPGSGRESVAQSAGLWSAGDFIPGVPNGNSIELCNGSPATSSSYVPQSTPTLGQDNGCGVPVEGTSWSRLKSIFR